MIEVISAAEAGKYFNHPSQRRFHGPGCEDIEYPDEGVVYARLDDVVGAFHHGGWRGVWRAHVACLPSEWGHVARKGSQIVKWFCETYQPDQVMAWTPKSNRAVNAMAARMGFRVYGEIPLGNETIVMRGL